MFGARQLNLPSDNHLDNLYCAFTLGKNKCRTQGVQGWPYPMWNFKVHLHVHTRLDLANRKGWARKEWSMLLQEWFLLHFSAFQTSTEVAYDFDICEILAYDSYCVYGLTITVWFLFLWEVVQHQTPASYTRGRGYPRCAIAHSTLMDKQSYLVSMCNGLMHTVTMQLTVPYAWNYHCFQKCWRVFTERVFHRTAMLS